MLPTSGQPMSPGGRRRRAAPPRRRSQTHACSPRTPPQAAQSAAARAASGSRSPHASPTVTIAVSPVIASSSSPSNANKKVLPLLLLPLAERWLADDGRSVVDTGIYRESGERSREETARTQEQGLGIFCRGVEQWHFCNSKF